MDEREVQRSLNILTALEIIQPNSKICTRGGAIQSDNLPWILQSTYRTVMSETFQRNLDDVNGHLNDTFKLINMGIDIEDKTCGELLTCGSHPYSSNLNFVRQQTTNRKNLKTLCSAMYKARKGMLEISETYKKNGNDIASAKWRRAWDETLEKLNTLAQTWAILQTKYPLYAEKSVLFVIDNEINYGEPSLKEPSFRESSLKEPSFRESSEAGLRPIESLPVAIQGTTFKTGVAFNESPSNSLTGSFPYLNGTTPQSDEGLLARFLQRATPESIKDMILGSNQNILKLAKETTQELKSQEVKTEVDDDDLPELI